MANVPTIVVGTGNQQKVVTPALLTGLSPTGTIVALKVDASGNLLTSGGDGAAVLSTATLQTPNSVYMDQFQFVTLLCDTVVQASSIYNPTTGIFTVPAAGVYFFEYAFAFTSTGPNWLSGFSQVLLNGANAQASVPSLASDATFFTGVTTITAAAGDTILVNAIINTIEGESYPVVIGAIMKLTRL